MSSNLRALGPNERLMLHHLRRLGSLAKADLARATELSSQSASVIINRLLDEKLVRKLEAVRGRVGQPSQPIALNPDGAYAIGIHIGRRSLEVMLLDLTGQARFRAEVVYPHPEVDAVFAAIASQLDAIVAQLGASGAARLCGIGVAAPLALGTWHQLLGQMPEQAREWANVDIRARLQAMTTLPVVFAKDTAAACVAELLAGRGRDLPDYLYVYLDALAGGSLVLGGRPHCGAHGNAGALGSMPLRSAAGERGASSGSNGSNGSNGVGRQSGPGERGGLPAQLLSVASLAMLEQRYTEAGLDVDAARDERALAAPWSGFTQAWANEAADALAYAVCNAACMVDLDAVIVDGKLGRGLLALLLAQVETALTRYDWSGVDRPPVLAGEVGVDANVIGAAYLALHAAFAPVA
ncbi:UNVERIFIED_ORG: putative NBD/HSP70 family sugar kinase [Zoogloea ramigera]|uniref:ROK family transcriptional regulator n=1 Tax=Duganella zoogloeoides TaxID=75659 RepID=A0ABZ0XTN6_9BURK|nr:ROK family transcriptional regulator [Duganella zoogloeoides]WQH03104.1 ROK family transcriptional regulator [Duganella zoogloeoides]